MRYTISQIRQALRAIIVLIVGEAPPMQPVRIRAQVRTQRRSSGWRG